MFVYISQKPVAPWKKTQIKLRLKQKNPHAEWLKRKDYQKQYNLLYDKLYTFLRNPTRTWTQLGKRSQVMNNLRGKQTQRYTGAYCRNAINYKELLTESQHRLCFSHKVVFQYSFFAIPSNPFTSTQIQSFNCLAICNYNLISRKQN